MNPSVLALVCTREVNEIFYSSLESICLQDYPNLTIAIYLDGIYSSLLHKQILDFCLSHKRSCVLKGLSYSVGLTKGLLTLQNCFSTDYYARLDVGDLWLTNKISEQIQCCLKYDYAIVGTRSQYIDHENKIIGFSEILPCDSNLLVQRISAFKGLYDHSSILFSKPFKYDVNWFYSQDMKLYVDIANASMLFGYLDESLTLVRFNESGITIRKRPLQLYYERG